MFKSLVRCQLCHVDPVWQFSVCQPCWRELPWLKQQVELQEQLIWAACAYTYPLDRVIQQFKYQQQLHWQALLVGLLQQAKPKAVQAIVPMPISTSRLIQRGYNQSLLLAKQLSKHWQLPIWQPITRQMAHSQKGLDRLERQAHISEQFHVAQTPKIRYRKVLILDDVVTTGASIHALSVKLYECGTEHVSSVCLAMAGDLRSAPRDHHLLSERC